MNICLLVDSFLPDIGGLQYSVHYLATAFTDFGHVVTVIAKQSKKKCPDPIHKYKLIRYGFRFPGSGRSGADNFSAVWTIINEHRKASFDLIHCHNVTYSAARGVRVNKYLRLPLIMTPHGDDVEFVPEYDYGMRLDKRWDRIIRKNLDNAHLITSISKAITKELKLLSKSKIVSISNGINLSLFSPKRDSYLHEVLNIDKTKKIVLSTGRNHPIKGFEFGIEAFKKISSNPQYDDLVYVIIGENSQTLMHLVQKFSLEKRIFLVDNQAQDELVHCYQSAWCFFSSSIMEGLSLVSLEAMACGLPLIVTDVPGNIDIVEANNCGLIVRNKDVDSMAEGITTLYANKKLYSTLSRNALEKIQLYDWHNIAGMYIDAYKDVIKTLKVENNKN